MPAAKEDAKEKLKDGLRINTSPLPTSPLYDRKRPGPLDLTGAKTIASTGAATPGPLATAKIIADINTVQYPEGVRSPHPELNQNAKEGKFRYDRDFLLQFMSLCKEKPVMLPPLDAIGLEPVDQHHMSRGGSGGPGRKGSSGAPPSRQGSIGVGFSPATFNGKPTNPFNMGNFATPGASKLSSEDRFAMCASARATSISGASGIQFTGGPPTPMTRTANQGGPGAPLRDRTRSKRGEKRDDKSKPPGGGQQGYGGGRSDYQQQQMMNLEPVAPLQTSANRWDRKALAIDAESPEMVDRKVKGLLNKLTMEKFDSISDQILAWANKSEKEMDGRTLGHVIRLVSEHLTDEATWPELYARLCRKIMEQISPKVQDDSIKNNEGKPVAGGQLFIKYLLNRCQEDFERGWVAKETTAAAAVAKAADDQAVKAASEKAKEAGKEDEVALYSEEYYAAQKAKRQGLGLIKFIGELFKLQMLTERIMHECVKKLLGNVDNPEEEEIESLCKLLTTVGKILDTPKARAHLDVYFSRMKELTKSPNVNSRMQYMLLDLIELRERKWVNRQHYIVQRSRDSDNDEDSDSDFSIHESDDPSLYRFDKILRSGPTAIESHVLSLLKLNMTNYSDISNDLGDFIRYSLSRKFYSDRNTDIIFDVIFKKATDYIPRSTIYAQLCCRIIANLDSWDEHRFKMRLLDRCRENFRETFGNLNRPCYASPSSAKSTDLNPPPEAQFEATYVVLQAKRQALGVVKFMAELYNVGILPPSQMYYGFTDALLWSLKDADEERLEALCILFTTAGRKLEKELDSEIHFEEQFALAKGFISSSTISPRTKNMLLALIECRENGWIPPKKVIPPLNAQVQPPEAGDIYAGARFLTDITQVQYPSGIKGPDAKLNLDARAGEFRYDREFLLQFMGVCKEKPANLAITLAILNLECQARSQPRSFPTRKFAKGGAFNAIEAYD